MSDYKKQVNIKKSQINTKNVPTNKKSNKTTFIVIGLAAIIFVGFFTIKAVWCGSSKSVVSSGEDI